MRKTRILQSALWLPLLAICAGCASIGMIEDRVGAAPATMGTLQNIGGTYSNRAAEDNFWNLWVDLTSDYRGAWEDIAGVVRPIDTAPHVRFTVVSESTLTLELLDVSGRVIKQRDAKGKWTSSGFTFRRVYGSIFGSFPLMGIVDQRLVLRPLQDGDIEVLTGSSGVGFLLVLPHPIRRVHTHTYLRTRSVHEASPTTTGEQETTEQQPEPYCR